jgi:hypothetical protein
MGPRGIKNSAGQVYVPHYYKRALDAAISRGEEAVIQYVRGYLYKPPSDGYKKLEDVESLDLACEALVADEAKPYAFLFTDEDRVAANERLAPHVQAIEDRKAEERARIDAKRAEIKRNGLPRTELDASLRTRRDLG